MIYLNQIQCNFAILIYVEILTDWRMITMTSKLLRGILAAAIASAAAAGSAVSVSAYELERHTQAEIKDMYEKMYFDDFNTSEYMENYTAESPTYAGRLSDDTLDEGLNSVNFCRYLAGLPYDVTLNDEYNTLAQNASLIIYMNQALSHKPEKPAAMGDNVYSLAYKGAGESNIGKGYMNIQASVVEGYMSDTDEHNISVLGHRRWILNPDIQQTGLGMVEDCTAMYVRDKTRDDKFTGDYICWPPANMPYEMIGSNKNGYAYSVTLNPSVYEAPDRDKVTVTMTSKLLNKTWTFDKNSPDKSSQLVGYFNVNTDNCGINNCIIFNPGVLPENDVIDVKITGIYKKTDKNSSVESPLSYKVTYFDLLNESDYTLGFPEKTYELEVGGSMPIRGYDNPLSSGDYSIWNICDSGDIKDYFTMTQSGGNTFVKAKKEGVVELFLGTKDEAFMDKCTKVTITHVHNRSGWNIDKVATETEPGSRYRKCLDCGKIVDKEILPATSVAAADIEVIADDYSGKFNYTGSAIEPRVRIYSSGKRLIQGTDYELSYSDNTATGTGHITVTGKGYFKGETTVDFTIAKRDPVSIDKLSINYKSDGIIYTGKAIEPKLTIKEGTYTLVQDTDYSVSYENNLNAGTGRMTITGMGDYEGSVSYDFTIEPADIGYPWASDKLSEVKFSGMPIMLRLSLKSQVSGEELVEDIDYTVSYENNTEIGTATVTVTGKGNYCGTTVNTFDIVSPEDYKGPEERDDVIEIECNAAIAVSGIEGAEVIFVNMATGQQYKAASVVDGTYYADLPDGEYVVWVIQSSCVPVQTNITAGSVFASADVEMHKYGDINKDSKINVTDTSLSAAFTKAIRAPSDEEQRQLGDVNRDGRLTVTDTSKIAAHAKGIKMLIVEEEFEIPPITDENGKSLNSPADETPQDNDPYDEVKAGYLEEFGTEWGDRREGLPGYLTVDIDGDGMNELYVIGSYELSTPDRLYTIKDGSTVMLTETSAGQSMFINERTGDILIDRTEDGASYTEVYTLADSELTLREKLVFSETAADDADFGEYERTDLEGRALLFEGVPDID